MLRHHGVARNDATRDNNTLMGPKCNDWSIIRFGIHRVLSLFGGLDCVTLGMQGRVPERTGARLNVSFGLKWVGDSGDVSLELPAHPPLYTIGWSWFPCVLVGVFAFGVQDGFPVASSCNFSSPVGGLDRMIFESLVRVTCLLWNVAV